MKKVFLVFPLFLLVSCGTTKLSQEGQSVEVVDSVDSAQCKQVQNVEVMQFYGKEEGAINKLRNEAAKTGANRLKVEEVKETEHTFQSKGMAYLCE